MPVAAAVQVTGSPSHTVSLTGSVVIVGGTSTVTGPSLLASTETNWQHIALTYDKISGEAIFYRDGEEFSKTTLADLDWEITSGAVTIGPQGARNNLLMLLDEFKISNIARTPTEVAYAGYKSKSAPTLNANLSAQIPSHLQSLTQAITMETDFWSSEVASLGSDLFFDTILSKNQTASCASCHVEALDFTDGLAIAESDESTTLGARGSQREIALTRESADQTRARASRLQP